jgi:uncharacterized protein (TIGR03437 family)
MKAKLGITRKTIKDVSRAAAWVLVCCNTSLAQTLPSAIAQEPATILEIQIQNAVLYADDATGPSQLATTPGIAPRTAKGIFLRWVYVGDIISVNGKATKGVAVGRGTTLYLTPNNSPGQSIADTNRNDTLDFRFEIQQPDGTPIGTIMTMGLSGGVAPPGAPLRASVGNNAITGGTGAFLGASGYMGTVGASHRIASMTEDPANRRMNGGGPALFILHVIPMRWPEVATGPAGPAVFHADFSPVTAAKPAKAGEVLVLFASGLGPTRPGVDPGQPFTTDPLQVVNSAVQVLVNGKVGDLLYAGGYPGTVNNYQVNFRVPDGIAAGQASIQLTAAWVMGPSVNIPIQ